MRTKILNIYTLCFFILLPNIAIANDPLEHICIVKESLSASGYSYIRCQDESSREYWIAVSTVNVAVGEYIEFRETPPLVNYKQKVLNKNFPRIYFVAGIAKTAGFPKSQNSVEKQVNTSMAYTRTEDNGSIYRWQSEDGAIILTDDISKVPKVTRERSFQKKQKPIYVLFVDESEYMGARFKAFYDNNNIGDLAGHKMVTVHALIQPLQNSDDIFLKKEMYIDVDCQEEIATPVSIIDAGEIRISGYKKAKRKINREEAFENVSRSLYLAICAKRGAGQGSTSKD
jgi:hypothetical protein